MQNGLTIETLFGNVRELGRCYATIGIEVEVGMQDQKSLHVASFKTNRINATRVAEMLALLVGESGIRILLLQGMSSWPTYVEIIGWQIFRTASCYC